MNECNIVKLVQYQKENMNIANLGFVLCAPDELENWLSYITQQSETDLAIVAGRGSGDIREAIEGVEVSKIVLVTTLIIGPKMLAELESVATDEKNMDEILLHVLEKGIEMLSKEEQLPSA